MLPLLAWISSMRMELATAASSTCERKSVQECASDQHMGSVTLPHQA
jgi:hypothetical protein